VQLLRDGALGRRRCGCGISEMGLAREGTKLGSVEILCPPALIPQAANVAAWSHSLNPLRADSAASSSATNEVILSRTSQVYVCEDGMTIMKGGVHIL